MEGTSIQVELAHSAENGTTVEGDTRPIKDTIKDLGLRWSKRMGFWYVPNSRGHNRPRRPLEGIAAALRQAGAEVAIEIGEDLTFEERQDLARERSAERAERLEERGDRALAEAAGQFDRAHRAVEHIPMGQPILVGHHSERRHRGDLERSDRAMRKGIEAQDRGAHLRGRAQAARRNAERRERPDATARRIDRLETELRDIERQLDGTSRKYGYERATGAHQERLLARRLELEDEIAGWKRHLEEVGGLVCDAERAKAVRPGDRVQGRWGMATVLRVNKKSFSAGYDDDRQYIVREAVSSVPFDEVGALHPVDCNVTRLRHQLWAQARVVAEAEERLRYRGFGEERAKNRAQREKNRLSKLQQELEKKEQ